MSISAPTNGDEGLVTITTDSGDTLTVHAAVNIGHSKSSMITKHPVEKGFKIADHIRPENPKVTIEGVVSNLPPSGNAGDVDTAYAFFKGLHEDPELCTIVTPRETYEQMAMATETVPEKSSNGNALEFTVAFEYIRIVSTKKTIANVQRGARKKVGKAEPFTLPQPIQGAGARQYNKRLSPEQKQKAKDFINKFGNL